MSKFWNWFLGKPQETKKKPSDALSEALGRDWHDDLAVYEPGPGPVLPYDGKPNPYRTQHPFGKPFLWGDNRDERALFVAEGPVFVPGVERATVVAVDTHTEISFAYCQKGHLHEYHNDKLVSYDKEISKHYTHRHSADIRPVMGWADKTIVEVEACDD